MIRSMTAFASRQGAAAGASWSWEMRGVNGRGLDLRFRLPDGLGALEQPLRAKAAKVLARGNVTVGLRLGREEGEAALRLDAAQLDRVLAALEQISDRAMAQGLTLAQPTAADVLSHRGVVAQGAETVDLEALAGPITEDFDALLTEFSVMREAEGTALDAILQGQLDEIAALVDAAETAAAERLPKQRESLKAALARVMEDHAADEARLAQELALLAVKADVTEEIDRLRAHVGAARDLLAAEAPAGRKLDFLAQEFNREANTLCSKAGSAALTAIGLDLKALIDRMREQIQNVE